MALVAKGLSYTYAVGTGFATPALRNVDLTVERGAVAVVLGATGSGKSTLLRLCAGLLEPGSGSVTADGTLIAGHGARPARGMIGLAFQNPEAQLFAESVLDDVAFGPRNLGMPDPEAAARHALARVGLDPDEFCGRSPFTLSGGEARRVALAGVLAMSPAYLLLDEPTAGLDPLGRSAVRDAIAAARERAGVVIVTHDAEDFLGMADEIVGITGGEEAFRGAPAELLASEEPWRRAGIRLPEIVRVQLLAAHHGARIDAPTLEPESAALLLARAIGGAQ
ncbi:MAG: ATP-binding cassette domain-containing protein [Anaerosomatales bacterium]|nr:ATP-binding cassette domain-containing protein [Anaerosomatales bacterium]